MTCVGGEPVGVTGVGGEPVGVTGVGGLWVGRGAYWRGLGVKPKGMRGRGCRWVACCAGVECSWWAAGWGWGEKVGANVEQVDAVKLGVVDDGDAAIDVGGDDGVGVGTGGIVLDTKAFGFHVALCEEGVFESGTPEGHGHGGWK